MDPIFEPIFDFSENMAGYPFSFSKPQTYWDEAFRREPAYDASRIFQDIFGDQFPFPRDSFPNNFPRPFWMTPGYVAPAYPRRDYILDQEPGPSSSSGSFYSSTYSSDSNGQRYESIKASVKQPDGVVINKEIIRKDGREVTTTTTIYPDGRQESRTETSEGVITDSPLVLMPSPEDIFKRDGIFSNLRRWFGF
ncbi:hypothetical protein ECG_03077 [Echinococcus granulosus]|uniref:Expressed conserved protein n=1 Tax=Echinococcus granulosus TaxID=6210 RepID=U6J9H6_ECHGR|nr:hypothetical protein EGR_03087 [Echinococcus granulosus]EUB62066.1 hypothetical protein EGR_03087 [Echinococcus granulosus]KAH9284424.1 hypothetical protein ECG_03077 [Echinococcus granulosus]CDS19952.1 expressed conserved protein [Echinococcus granulosus]